MRGWFGWARRRMGWGWWRMGSGWGTMIDFLGIVRRIYAMRREIMLGRWNGLTSVIESVYKHTK